MELQLHLIGAGRHPLTKEKRRLSMPKRRAFWLGGMFVTPGITYPVTVEWCRANLAAVCSCISEGTVLVQHARDNFVTPEELRLLCNPETADEALSAAEAEFHAKQVAMLEETEAALQSELAAGEQSDAGADPKAVLEALQSMSDDIARRMPSVMDALGEQGPSGFVVEEIPAETAQEDAQAEEAPETAPAAEEPATELEAPAAEEPAAEELAAEVATEVEAPKHESRHGRHGKGKKGR